MDTEFGRLKPLKQVLNGEKFAIVLEEGLFEEGVIGDDGAMGFTLAIMDDLADKGICGHLGGCVEEGEGEEFRFGSYDFYRGALAVEDEGGTDSEVIMESEGDVGKLVTSGF